MNRAGDGNLGLVWSVMGETLTGKQRDRSRKETEADETEAEERRGANLHVCGGRVVPVLHQLLVRVVRVGVVVLRCQLELFGRFDELFSFSVGFALKGPQLRVSGSELQRSVKRPLGCFSVVCSGVGLEAPVKAGAIIRHLAMSRVVALLAEPLGGSRVFLAVDKRHSFLERLNVVRLNTFFS